jgi:hypothetical protein
MAFSVGEAARGTELGGWGSPDEDGNSWDAPLLNDR